MKTLLIGILVVSPTLVYWARRIDSPSATQTTSQSLSADVPVSIPVEVIENGSAPKWIYVQVGK